MINVKEEALKKANGKLERFKIKCGLARLPADWALRSLQEYAQSHSSIGIGETILFPKLYYYSSNAEFGEDDIRFECGVFVNLRDETGDINAVVSHTSLGPDSKNLLTDYLAKMNDGEPVYFPVMRNGMHWPYRTKPDTTLYLLGFHRFHVPKQKTSFSRLFSDLENLALPLVPATSG